MTKVLIQTFITTEIDTETGKSRIIKQFSRPLKEFKQEKTIVDLKSSEVKEEWE